MPLYLIDRGQKIVNDTIILELNVDVLIKKTKSELPPINVGSKIELTL